MVKFAVPVTVGVPVMAPVAAFRFRPRGSAPTVTDHAYGSIPPVAANVWEYAPLIKAPGRLFVVITSGAGGITTIDNDWSAVCPPVSARCNVKFAVPRVVAVPVIAPVLAFKFRPAGRDPVEIDQTYGRIPPLAAAV